MTNDLVSASLPIFGLLACLFVGFMALSGDTLSGERVGYWFFALGVAWLIITGVLLWPEMGRAASLGHGL